MLSLENPKQNITERRGCWLPKCTSVDRFCFLLTMPTVESTGMFTSFYRNFYVVFYTVTKLWNITKLCSVIYLFWWGGGSFEGVEWGRTRL